MNWLPINQFVRPTEDYDYSFPQILVFSPSKGIKIARCIKSDDTYYFTYDRDEYTIKDITHWMPLPPHPY